MVYDGGREKLWSEFIPSGQDLVGGGISVDESSGKKTLAYFEYGESVVETVEFITDFFIPALYREIRNSKQIIRSNCRVPGVDIPQYLNLLSKEISILLEAAERKLNSREAEQFKRILSYLARYIKRYSVKKALENKESSRQLKSFKVKEEFRASIDTILTSIFRELQQLQPDGFLNIEKTDLKTFINILKSKNIETEERRIFFTCQVTQIALIIEKLSYYFEDLNPTTIGDSGLFIKPNGETLKRTDLYPLKSKGKYPKNYELINQVFKNLK